MSDELNEIITDVIMDNTSTSAVVTGEPMETEFTEEPINEQSANVIKTKEEERKDELDDKSTVMITKDQSLKQDLLEGKDIISEIISEENKEDEPFAVLEVGNQLSKGGFDEIVADEKSPINNDQPLSETKNNINLSSELESSPVEVIANQVSPTKKEDYQKEGLSSEALFETGNECSSESTSSGMSRTRRGQVVLEEKAKMITEEGKDELKVVNENPKETSKVTVIEIDDDDDEANTSKNEIKNSPTEDVVTKTSPKPETLQSEPMLVDEVKLDSITVDTEMKNLGEYNESVDPSNLLEETAVPSEDNLIIDEDLSGEIYYNKECVNYECPRKHKQFFRAPIFALSYFKIAKKKFKPQFICADCYDQALDMYEEFCGLLVAKQPLLLKDIVGGRQEFVEIIDSSDEEDEDDSAEKKKFDNTSFSTNDIKLIENELENSIKSVLDQVEIQNQLTWSKTILTSRLKALEEETNSIDTELRSLQKRADHMHVTLYQCPKIKVRHLQPLDLNSGLPYPSSEVEITLPPIGEILRPPIQINETYYAVKNKAIASWVPCKVIEQVDSAVVAQKNIKQYKIKFLKSQYQMLKTLSVKHLAYFDPPSVRLPIGSRVIAYFDATSLSRGKEKMMIQSAFYPGVIAEPLKPNNKYRYLIFYDDGYTQYVSHKDVRLVCHVSENVWEDVHPGSRDFIQKYLTQYSINRPMVQTQKGQSMTTESNGKWIYARVVDIDCSLIQMQFEGPKSHTEWIYRGSMRLGPVFKENQKALQKNSMPISRLPRRTEPFIRYTEDEEATSTQQQQQRHMQQQNEPRAVAKKSVSRQDSLNTAQQGAPMPVRHLNNSTIYLEDENKPKGKVVYYTAKRNMPPLLFKQHECNPGCLFKITHNLNAYSPLSKPLLSGWERMIIRQKVKKVVAYRAPCGKIMRNMKELRHYLRATDNVLNVDNFDFSPETNCLAEYVIESAIVQKRDISCGQEKMAIPLVNYYDNTMPPECKYSAKRIPTEGVNLNLDEEFLVGCDCEDDCSDKTKCSCWQLTYAGAKYGNPNTPMEEIGYQYKRLYEHVPTGIYECNSRCKCKPRCLNRVVQHSLEMKLQVFKTSNRGWGLRCINDVPRGSFICVYAGHLLTEAKANEGGLDAGDEYFAELDYIEVAEQIKEGYESEVETPEPEEEEEFIEREDDDEFTPSRPLNVRTKSKYHRSTRGSQSQNTEEDSQERQVINFNPNAVMDENSMRESSIRTLFGKDEACYVMDAKITGNLGRYFNHSCSPNLFVQNVFVDTHDLRFPWVAFFASTHIRAGTELTWNYNYEVGVVPGKVLYCQCGAPNCRLRLL